MDGTPGQDAQKPCLKTAQIRTATPADLSYVKSLARRFSNQIGFLPEAALLQYLESQKIKIALDNGDPVGYLLGNNHLRWQPLLRPITQAAVQFDAQRRHHGQSLLTRTTLEAIAAGQVGLQACCREDLDANEFWRSQGFVAICYLTPTTARQHPIICWRKPLVKKLPLWFASPPMRAGYQAKPPAVNDRSQRIAYDRRTP